LPHHVRIIFGLYEAKHALVSGKKCCLPVPVRYNSFTGHALAYYLPRASHISPLSLFPDNELVRQPACLSPKSFQAELGQAKHGRHAWRSCLAAIHGFRKLKFPNNFNLLFAVGSNTPPFRAVRVGNANKNVVLDPTVQ
jgi:hypothetical protein